MHVLEGLQINGTDMFVSEGVDHMTISLPLSGLMGESSSSEEKEIHWA